MNVKSGGMGDVSAAGDGSNSALARQAVIQEQMFAPVFHFHVEHLEPPPGMRQKAIIVRDKGIAIRALAKKTGNKGLLIDAERYWEDYYNMLVPVWADDFHNLVTTVGKNDLLDKYFAGSGYTATWYFGLISSVSWSAVDVADTMASHAGWTEAGAVNAPNYTATPSRGQLAFAAASGGSKATSSAEPFAISQAGTVKGAFTTSDSTKGGSTGILYSAGTFTGGDRIVDNGDTLNVSGSWSLT